MQIWDTAGQERFRTITTGVSFGMSNFLGYIFLTAIVFSVLERVGAYSWLILHLKSGDCKLKLDCLVLTILYVKLII